MPEDKLAGLERSPALERRRTLSRRLPPADHEHWILAAAPEKRAADAIAVAEVLLVKAAGECGGRLIREIVDTRAPMPGQLRHAGSLDFRKLRDGPRQHLPDLLIPAFHDRFGSSIDGDQDMDVLSLVVFLGIPNRVPVREVVRTRIANDVAA